MEKELFCVRSENASHRLILLHGWGADAEDLIPLGHSLLKEIDKNVELISLRAPQIHPQGFGRQWYKLFPADWIDSEKATNLLNFRLKAISNEQIPLEKTVLLGFSQGGAMALSVGVNLPLAGVIGCSSYPHPGFEPSSDSPPVFLTHGDKDPVVPIEASKNLLEIFKKKSVNYSKLIVFAGGHEIPQEIEAKMNIFIERCFR